MLGGCFKLCLLVQASQSVLACVKARQALDLSRVLDAELPGFLVPADGVDVHTDKYTQSPTHSHTHPHMHTYTQTYGHTHAYTRIMLNVAVGNVRIASLSNVALTVCYFFEYMFLYRRVTLS